MVSAVTVTVSTWRLVMRLKLVKQLVQSLPNLSGNLVHSLQCVPSTRVGLPQIPISLRVFHRVQEIFEARNPKGEAVITEVKGEVTAIEEDASTRTKKVFVKGETGEGEYVVPFTARMRVQVGDQISRGAALTEGSIQPKRLLAVRDVLSVETYLLGEVQKVYRSQGVEIGDKHIEVMVRQ